ncbi:MAG: VTT domain-containing protein [Aequorivita sp.]|nr:VTT domain-containing protein [Aequorivita sp.]
MSENFGEKKVNLSKIIIFCATIVVAVLIVSFTVGKEMYEGKSDSMFSFGAVHFAGYLFFLLMPVEAAFVYYLSFYREIELIGVALGTAFVAQLIDYLIGYSFSLKFIHKFVGEKRLIKAEKHIRKYGNLTIFVFNLFPLSSPVIALVAGMLKYRLNDLIVYSLIGLILKYVILSLVF